MAIQITSVGLSNTPGNGRAVVRDSSGIPYVLVDTTQGAADERVQIWKGNSSTPTSFSLEDSITLTSGLSSTAMAIDSNDLIHVVYWDEDSKNGGLFYATFNTSTGSFSSGTQVVAHDAGSESEDVSIAIDSNDIPHAVFNQGITSMGTEYSTVYYVNKVGGSWNSEVEIDGVTNGNNSYNPQIAIDDGNIPVISYSRFVPSVYKLAMAEGNQNNATSFTLEVTNTNQSTSITSIAVDTSGNHYAAQAGTLKVYKHNSSDAWSTWTDISPSSVSAPSVSLAIDGTDVYVFYENGSTDDLVYDKYTGTWDGETTLESGPMVRAESRWSYYNNPSYSTYDIDCVYREMTDGEVAWTSLSVGGGATSYTLTADQASFTLTGQSVSFSREYTMVATQSNFTLTGQDATFSLSVTMTADQGSFALTGQAIGFINAEVLSGGQGSFTLTGQSVTLSYLRNLTLTADQASFILTGQDAGLDVAEIMVASQGSFTLSGQDVNFQIGSILTADQANFILTGQSVDFLNELVMTASQASFALTGIAVGFDNAEVLVVSHGSFTLSGQGATFKLGNTMDADQVSFSLTGQDINFASDLVIVASQGSIALTGFAVGFDNAEVLVVSHASFSLSGQDVTFAIGNVLVASQASFVLDGQEATFDRFEVIIAEHGSFVLSGQSVNLSVGQILLAEQVSFALSGQSIGFINEEVIQVINASFNLDGIVVNLNYNPIQGASAPFWGMNF